MRFFRFVACLCVLVLLFSGCQSAENGQNDQNTPISQTDATTETLSDRNALRDQAVTGAGKVEFRGGGRQRIAYTGAVSQVQYITSVEQLPDLSVFGQYDAAFFRENALVLVTQSTSSGSAQLEIESLLVDNGTVKVKLKQTAEGEGTADMAAWLIWVEVDAGLELQWEMETTSKGIGLNVQTH